MRWLSWIGSVVWAQVLIRGVYVHGGEVDPSIRVDVLIQGDSIAQIGTGLSIPGATIVQAQGLHLYPALIALGTPTGLIEIEAVRATRDENEVGTYNPNVQAYIAYNADSRVLPTLRANGILYAEAAPRGDVIAGQSALMQLYGRTREEACLLPAAQLYLYPPSLRPSAYQSYDDQKKALERAREAWQGLYDFFEAAARWCGGDSARRDLRYQALCPYLGGQRPVVIEVHWREDIEAALAFARRWGLKVAILGGEEAPQLAEALRQAGAAVILQRTHALPLTEDAALDQRYTLPAVLLERGVTVLLAHESFWNQRNLAYQAGTAGAYGLPPEKALALVTQAPAQWLGLSRLGRIAPGYKASLVLTEGDLLDPTTSRPVRLWLAGREIPLSENPQEQLYQRYR